MTRSDEDAVWRSIVENYGERVQLDEPEPPPLVVPQAGSSSLDRPADEAQPQPGEAEPDDDPADHFVPPEPPPVLVPEPPRLLAWAGVLGVPVAAILLAVLHVTVPAWAGTLGLAWFVGGFGYLVATMRRGEDDDWDDGAVL